MLLNHLTSMTRRLIIPCLPQQYETTAGMKVKKFLKLRCKHCYFTLIDGRMNVMCYKFPRHKQMEPFDVKLLW